MRAWKASFVAREGLGLQTRRGRVFSGNINAKRLEGYRPRRGDCIVTVTHPTESGRPSASGREHGLLVSFFCQYAAVGPGSRVVAVRRRHIPVHVSSPAQTVVSAKTRSPLSQFVRRPSVRCIGD
jgi:hypothetical protein